MTVARAALLLGSLMFGLSGCGSDGKNAVNDPRQESPKVLVGHAQDESELPEGIVLHKSREVDAPARVSRTPEVTDDPAEIDRTRAVFEQGIHELYDRAISLISQGEWVYSEHTLALKSLREKAIVDLREMIHNNQLAPAVRTNAAEQLASLNDPAGMDFLFDSLESASADLRLAALKSLRKRDQKTEFSDMDRATRVLALLADPDERIVLAAAELCTHRSIPGTEATLIGLLEKTHLNNRAEIAEKLAGVANTRRAVDALLPHVLKDKSGEFSQWTGYVFLRLIEHPDPDVAEPVRTALYNYTLQFQRQRYDQILVDYLAKSAGRDAIPVLEDIHKNASDPVSRGYAMEALARLQPERAIDLLIEHVQREGVRSGTGGLLRRHATERDFDRIAPVLVASLKTSNQQLDAEIVRLFLIEFGTRGDEFIKHNMEALDDNARMWAAWKLEGMNLVAALTELHAVGVIQKAPDELINEMQKARDRSDDKEPVDVSDPNTLLAALAQAGIVTMFDAETSEIPCYHDRLIFTFADACNGQFLPQWPVQFWHRANVDDYDGPYTVQFVYRNRLFRVGAENYGDWYDVDAVVRLLNFALETSGQSQRFITLESDGQIAAFVFADRAAFLPIANKYRLPLSPNADRAMRKGIEFERRVLERSK